MDKNIGILHLSDIHACEDNKKTIEELVSLLKKDLDDIQQKYNVKVRLICITGDLINSGDKAKIELNIVLDKLIQPLIEFLQLSESDVFVVPGNHEVDRSKVIPYVESGLLNILKKQEDIEVFMKSNHEGCTERIDYFDKEFGLLFNSHNIFSNEFIHTHMIKIDELKVGIVCVNSAWRSTGCGGTEKGRMVVGSTNIIVGLESINTADIKICMMHHPLDWLVDADKNAIEKCINQFDIILNGHIHELNTQQSTTFNGITLFNTCGKFSKTSDIYNGYTLLSINPCNKNCDALLRQYYPHPRNDFDSAIHLCKDGVFHTPLGKKDNELALAYDIVHAIKTRFSAYANSFYVSNVYHGAFENTFEESYIVPKFSTYSEYEKETDYEIDDDQNDQLEDICKKKKNYLLIGKKEIGKTTLLHYIAKYCIRTFNSSKTVPLIIDCSLTDFSGKEVVERALHKFICEYCDDSYSFSKNDVKQLLDKGMCTIMFDSYDEINNNFKEKIDSFINKYDKNKYIFSIKEMATSRVMHDTTVLPKCVYDKRYICSLTKGQIRKVAIEKFCPYSGDEKSSLVDKIVICFNKTSLPKTPFVLSLILSLCDNAEFSPINEAVVLEQFMESLLEKSSSSEANLGTFDFRNKEDFLIFLASYMNDTNTYALSEKEFEKILYEYHENTGFLITDTNFDKLFFEKGILIITHSKITFRYSCMIEYYLAKRAINDTGFLDSILEDKKYINYPNEILYYTGLNRKDTKILSKLDADLNKHYENLNYMLEELSNYKIGLDFSIPEEQFTESIINQRLTQEQSDNISDCDDNSEKILPEKIDKRTTYNNTQAFINTLLIYGNCIKNLELISKDTKSKSFENYLHGLCLWLAIFKHNTEEFSNSENNASTEQEDKIVEELFKLGLPIYIQNIALENIGTSKLKMFFDETFSNRPNDSFDKLFCLFTICDLRLKGFKNMLVKYVNSIDNKSLLKIVFAKLMYYYCFRYFDESFDNQLENILANINIKMNNESKLKKSMVIKQLKEQKQQIDPNNP